MLRLSRRWNFHSCFFDTEFASGTRQIVRHPSRNFCGSPEAVILTEFGPSFSCPHGPCFSRITRHLHPRRLLLCAAAILGCTSRPALPPDRSCGLSHRLLGSCLPTPRALLPSRLCSPRPRKAGHAPRRCCSSRGVSLLAVSSVEVRGWSWRGRSCLRVLSACLFESRKTGPGKTSLLLPSSDNRRWAEVLLSVWRPT